MTNYIYELDVAHLRISYILPEGYQCDTIATNLANRFPHDRTNLEIYYSCGVYKLDKESGHCIEITEFFRADSLQELVKKVRTHFQLNKHLPVHKSPDDGTDSVISTA